MITVYSKDSCNKCGQAIMLLKMKGVEHEVLKLGVDYDYDKAVELSNGQKEFPLIYVDGSHLGGLEALKQHLS